MAKSRGRHLATDLSSFPLLISKIKKGSDLVIGSRFHHDSKVKRLFLRRFFSSGYFLMAKLLVGTKIKDLPCGFKAINAKIKENILPLVKNKKWFFDSELTILAEKSNYKIKEIPVVWQDFREGEDKTRVSPFSLSLVYIKELLSLRKRLKKYYGENNNSRSNLQ